MPIMTPPPLRPLSPLNPLHNSRPLSPPPRSSPLVVDEMDNHSTSASAPFYTPIYFASSTNISIPNVGSRLIHIDPNPQSCYRLRPWPSSHTSSKTKLSNYLQEKPDIGFCATPPRHFYQCTFRRTCCFQLPTTNPQPLDCL